MPKTIQQNTEIEISSVEEKIKLEKHLPFNPGSKAGPDVDLFFHELPSEQSAGQQLLQLAVSLLIGFFGLISLPFVALYIKIRYKGPIFKKRSVVGKRGRPFKLLTYNLGGNGDARVSRLAKLPSVINIWKGDLNLVGPQAYPPKWCNKWNENISDFYKRFALRPGLIGVAPSIQNPTNIDEVSNCLHQEFKYLLAPTFFKDLKIIFRLS